MSFFDQLKQFQLEHVVKKMFPVTSVVGASRATPARWLSVQILMNQKSRLYFGMLTPDE